LGLPTYAGLDISAFQTVVAAMVAAINSAASLPVNTTPPVISGVNTVGSVLTSTTGAWTNSPTSYQYIWTRGGVTIVGATASTYTLVALDASMAIVCQVKATNAAGSSGNAASNIITVGS
jgi:hypothetical protein